MLIDRQTAGMSKRTVSCRQGSCHHVDSKQPCANTGTRSTDAAAVGHGYPSTCTHAHGIDELSLSLSLARSLPPSLPLYPSPSLCVYVSLCKYVCIYIDLSLSKLVRVYIYIYHKEMCGPSSR